jgi:hypothetical protein
MCRTLRQLSINLLIVTGSLCFGFVSVHAVVHGRSTSPNDLVTHIETMGMIESVDRGLTWHFKGHAQFHAPTLNPVDPSVMLDNGKVVLYFFDLWSLAGDTSVVYMSQASDSMGLDFTTPDNRFHTGSFARVNYVPATDRKFCA